MNTTSTWHDPVVAEIHAVRERLADQYHNDLLAYSNAAEARCRALGLMMQEDPHPVSAEGLSVNESSAAQQVIRPSMRA